MKSNILNKIRNQTAKVLIFGLGYVGLSNAVVIAQAGFQVCGFDKNHKLVKAISRRNNNLIQSRVGSFVGQVSAKHFPGCSLDDNKQLKEADIVIICVPTPVRENRTPDLSCIAEVCDVVGSNLFGKLIIVESTLPPHSIRDFIAPLLEKNSHLRCGSDFWLCYCPERLSPGEAIENVIRTNRLLGGYNQESAEVATEFFKTFAKGQILVTDASTAELAKVVENTFRDVNIAFANEIALLCEHIGLDSSEVIKLANTHPRVNILTPGPGVGGACLPKDPYLLLFPVRSEDFKPRIIQSSRAINENMPQHVVDLVLRGLRDANKKVGRSNVAVFGTAYKANVEDARLSPSKSIIQKLKTTGVTVTAYDPLSKESFGARHAKSLVNAAKKTDCIVIATDHEEFKNMKLSEIATLMRPSPFIVDGRRIIGPEQAEDAGIRYYGIGFGRAR
jgi:UDP-N-acetyl-D-mannosaminuronic acid dehydrogenase